MSVDNLIIAGLAALAVALGVIVYVLWCWCDGLTQTVEALSEEAATHREAAILAQDEMSRTVRTAEEHGRRLLHWLADELGRKLGWGDEAALVRSFALAASSGHFHQVELRDPAARAVARAHTVEMNALVSLALGYADEVRIREFNNHHVVDRVRSPCSAQCGAPDQWLVEALTVYERVCGSVELARRNVRQFLEAWEREPAEAWQVGLEVGLAERDHAFGGPADGFRRLSSDRVADADAITT